MIAVPMKHDGWQPLMQTRELSDFWQVSTRLDMNYPVYTLCMHEQWTLDPFLGEASADCIQFSVYF